MSAGVIAVVRRELRRAPESARTRVRRGAVVVVLALLVIIADVVTGTYTAELFRLLSLLLAACGIGVLVLAQALHAAARAGTDAATGGVHRVHAALPAVCITAALLLVAAVALAVPLLPSLPLVVVPVLLLTPFVVIAVREGLHAAAYLYQSAQEQSRLTAEARAETAEARLAALRAQLHPHFLFNALNTVAALIRSDPPAAERALENTATVLRAALEHGERPEVRLDEELAFVEAWLEVERARFRERLQVSLELDPALATARVPPFSIQPLVENAIVHGLSARRTGGRVTVRTERSGGGVRVTVRDDGEGLAAQHTERAGLGNLRRRLAALYGPAARLTLDAGPDGGTIAVVEIPQGNGRPH